MSSVRSKAQLSSTERDEIIKELDQEMNRGKKIGGLRVAKYLMKNKTAVVFLHQQYFPVLSSKTDFHEASKV